MKSPTTGNKMKRPSEMLKDITKTPDEGEITMGDFVELLGDRSFALAILILALPNALPLPGIPGFSTVTGVANVFIALQILGGRDAIWLPRKMARKRFQQKRVTKIIGKALPAVLWFEKFLCPRLSVFCESAGEKVIGFFILAIGLVLAMPLLGGNFLPGFSISLLALALLEKDGLLALLSILFAVLSLFLMYLLVVIAGGGALEWISDIM